ncbi:amidase [Pseudomonas profundi]|uniref:amidase n=1 Tax=Pseudomonas profundi TaxID=1981513 RepID=UPI00123B7BF8|nr:amidase [Pseudomonas profundi]
MNRSQPLWMYSANELQTLFATGECDPCDVLESVLAHMDRVQPACNMMTALDRDGAMQAARDSAERWRRRETLSALDGVPVTVKDNIPVAGLPCCWGSHLYAGYRPQRDELPVARLRAAGATIFGKTNVPEFTLHGYTSNPLSGTTANPWDRSLTPGGSSGGAVTAVASGVGPLALGTDGGGSIRRPAGFTAVAGMKPGRGVVPRQWGLPEILPELEVVGPIARTVADLTATLRVISDAPAAYWDAAQRNSGARRILYWREIGQRPVDGTILERVDAVAEVLTGLGHRVERQPAPQVIDTFNQRSWPVLSAAGLAAVLEGKDAPEHLLTPPIRSILERGRAATAVELFNALQQVRDMRRHLAGLLQDYDLILTPTSAAMPWPAADTHPTHIAGQPVDGRGHAVFTAFANAAGLPALSLPAARDPADLPVGFQLVGPKGADALLLAIGQAYESCSPWNQQWPRIP